MILDQFPNFELSVSLPPLMCRTITYLATALGAGISWAIDGSCALALQGVNVHPHDIDILTDRAGAYSIETVLAAFARMPVEYGETERYRSYFGIFIINGIEVEVMGALQVFRFGHWSEIQDPGSTGVRHVLLEGVDVPVVHLNYLESSGYLDERLKLEADQS
ncbi:MAG: hypothetical protein M1138_03855 [Candidatus Thermoplasmatota archaeon]|nr:hypothetical protein [Candidatus Thermoplasmatota archaeon]